MDNKYIMYSLLVLLIFIVGLSAVSAGDINTTDATPTFENDNVDPIMSDTIDDDVMVGGNAQKDLTKNKIVDTKTESNNIETRLFVSGYYTSNDDGVNFDRNETRWGSEIYIKPKLYAYARYDTLELKDEDINVAFNGKTYITKYDKAVYLKLDKFGENTLSCYYKGNDIYAPSNTTIKFTVPKCYFSVMLDNDTYTAREGNINVTGRVNFYNSTEKLPEKINLTVVFNSNYNNYNGYGCPQISVTTDDYGRFSLLMPGDQTGYYIMNTVIKGTDYVYGNEYNPSIYIIEKNGLITTQGSFLDIQHKSGNTYAILVDLMDIYGHELNNKKIIINAEGKTYERYTGGNDYESYFNHTFKNYGKVDLSAYFAGDSKYAPCNFTYTNSLYNFYGETETKLTLESVNNIKLVPHPIEGALVTSDGNFLKVNYGENMTLTGKLTDNKGNPIKNAKIEYSYPSNIYTEPIIITTNDKGVYKFTIKQSYNYCDVGLRYAGSTTYRDSSEYLMFDIPDSKNLTDIYISKPLVTKVGDYVTLRANVTSWRTPYTYTPITININGKEYTNKTDGTGLLTYNYKTDTVGINNVTISYKGNSKFTAASSNMTFTVVKVDKTDTKITVNTIGDVQKDTYVTVTGRYTAATGINLTYTPIRIVVNGVTYTNKTNANGIYSYTFKASTIGTNNVTVSYAGNSRFNGDSASTTFNVLESRKTATKITVNSLGTVQKDSYVTVTGRYTAVTGINLTYTPIRININGVTYTNKTNGNGIYSYTFKASKIGVNNITVSYPGNSRFIGATASTTFNVTNKTATKITVNTIGDVQKDSYVTITGKYTAVTGINLTYTPIKILINGVTYTNKTNAYGIYSYRFKASTLGTNNVTTSYAGNSRFIGASASTTFKVVNKTATTITVNSLGTVGKDEYVTITGRYTASTGINLTYTPIKIVINGVTYTNKTNGNGIYSYTFKASTIGTNSVTVSYAGNSRFIGASASTTFNVVNKTSTKITVNNIGTVKANSYVTVTGKYTAATGINLTYTPIRININGVTYTNKTNAYGIYSYTFKPSNMGVNNITVSYPGNARFIGATAKTTLTVKQ